MKQWKLMIAGVAALVVFAGCQTTPVQQGAIAGGAVGAGLGAVAGSTMGKTGEGALIGAGAGALTGALLGDHIEKSTTPAPRPVQYVAPGPPPPPPVIGHYETRIVTTPTGERYEERVWVTR
ncbi:MAG: hypothetical protein GX580_17045 [Candidatus Hydrogenedens sp.]|nr:hypothetical protein [Candidatus Hydrogenedentota bacterium]NLF59339.1 hypothetical protein [Candidatus Hydrogenedens sp.]